MRAMRATWDIFCNVVDNYWRHRHCLAAGARAGQGAWSGSAAVGR